MSCRWIIIFCLLLIANSAFAAVDVHEFKNDTQRLRYQSFIDEMRCPKCQNQNLSGSDSPIATDLRNELYSMIQDGRSDMEIVDFMVNRYGEYILYRPRLSPVTIILWLGPAILLLLGIVVLILMVRRRRRDALEAGPQALNQAERERLQKLLEAIPQAKFEDRDYKPNTSNQKDSPQKENSKEENL